MGTTFRFLSSIEEASAVLDWFHALPVKPVESPCTEGMLFYFQGFGPLDSDHKKSPLVNVFLPTRKRGVLTTIGEVHFLTTPLSRFPELNKISKQFREWLSKHPCVHSHNPSFKHEWDYFLEGSACNWEPPIFALPSGMVALENGCYFVAQEDGESVLDRVCRALELRGVEGVTRT